MILSDFDIKQYLQLKKLSISNMTSETIRENGVDLSIGSSIAIDKHITILDLSKKEVEERELIVDAHDSSTSDRRFEIETFDESVIIPPRTNILLVTNESLNIPDNLMAFCCLRSTIARMGFVSPITIVDAGFEGTLTIEAFYGGNNPIKIYANDRFLHVVFAKTNSYVKNPYSGVYNGQTSVRLPKSTN